MDRLSALIEDLSRSELDHITWCGSPLTDRGVEELLDRLPEKPDPAEIREVSREDAAAWLSLLATQSLCHGMARGIERDEAELLWRKTKLALGDLSPRAKFFAIGVWQLSRRLKHWDQLRADGPWTDQRYSLSFNGPYLPGRGVLGAVMAFDARAAFLFAVVEDD